MLLYATDASAFRQRVPSIIRVASNVRGGPNPPYDVYTFAEMYPQFFEPPEDPEDVADSPGSIVDVVILDAGDPALPELKPVGVPLIFVEALVNLAHASIKHSRFHDAWKLCMGFFIAHFVVLYLATFVEQPATPYELAKAGQAGGLLSSKSVDSVSVKYDFSQMADDLEGWAEFKATAYGLQLATYAKMFSMPGMYVH